MPSSIINVSLFLLLLSFGAYASDDHKCKAFLQANHVFEEFSNIRLPSIAPDVTKILYREKLRLLEKLENAYLRVADTCSLVCVVESLFLLGCVYQEMANFFREAPLPARITKDKEHQLKKSLVEKALPWEDKAISFFLKAIQKSSFKKIASPNHSHLAFNRLSELTRMYKITGEWEREVWLIKKVLPILPKDSTRANELRKRMKNLLEAPREM